MATLPHLTHMPTVRLAMTPFPHSIDIDAPLEEAWAMMLKEGFRHLPVTEKGELRSLISERDLRLVLRPGTEQGERMVRDACHEDPELYRVRDDTPLDQVLITMAERHIGSCVVTRDDHLVGILTVTDVCRHLAALLRDRFGDSTPEKPTDAA